MPSPYSFMCPLVGDHSSGREALGDECVVSPIAQYWVIHVSLTSGECSYRRLTQARFVLADALRA